MPLATATARLAADAPNYVVALEAGRHALTGDEGPHVPEESGDLVLQALEGLIPLVHGTQPNQTPDGGWTCHFLRIGCASRPRATCSNPRSRGGDHGELRTRC